MSSTQNSISSLVAQFLRLQKNALEIINGLNEVATSTNDNVQIEMLDEAGFPTFANIPAYGYLRSQIQRLDSNVQSLAGLGENSATVRNPDGTYSQIFKSQPLRDPAPLVNLQIPSTFSTKDNWFFDSFLSPLLFISIDATGQLPADADRILVKRIIANTDTEDKKLFFDNNLRGRNDLSEQGFIDTLSSAGISFFVDEDIIDLPLRTIRNKGNFSVISFYDDTISTTDANGQSVQETRRNFKLNTLNYTDTSTNVENGRTLNVGQTLLTPDGTQYQITSINLEETSVQLKRVNGFQPVQIGADALSLQSTEFSQRLINVNIGYDERQGIFFKKIDDYFNIVSSNWSSGVVFFSNELRINTTSGVQTLEQFYLSSVADIGQMFLNMAKEKKIGAINGLVPDAPLIASEDFKVVQINTQLTESSEIQTLNQKIAEKDALRSEINQIDTAISTRRSQINSASNTSVIRPSVTGGRTLASSTSSSLSADTQNTQSLESDLNSLTQQREQKQKLLSSIIEDISTISEEIPALSVEPKYRVRGFWPIPAPKISPFTGSQAVIQFIIEYRYLSDSGVAPNVNQISFVDNNGQVKTGSFSNWNKIVTDIRKKVYDTNTGTYVWAPEQVDNSDVPNINQLDIPITEGERVEIRIKSVSEAGWPDNPVTSNYSETVVVAFPPSSVRRPIRNEITANEVDRILSAQRQELSSTGMNLLLSRQFTSGDRTYLLDAQSIYSGFFSDSGNPVDLFQKISDLQNEILNLRAVVERAVGTLEVFVIDTSGNSQLVTNGSTISLNGGFYNQIFTNPLGSDAGKIASNVFEIQILNSSAGVLELSSVLPGGLSVPAGISSFSYPDGYVTNLRYGEIGISVTSLVPGDIIPPGSTGGANEQSFQLLRQAAPFVSGNANSQFIYPRWKSVGFDSDLYVAPSPYVPGYDYLGDTSGLPRNGSSLIPFNPSSSTVPTASGTNANVWNGGYTGSTGSYSGLGNGTLSEFCIQKNHPALSTGLSFTNLVLPDFSNGVVVYPYFRQADFLYTDTETANYFTQLAYSPVVTNFVQGATATREDSMYPRKLGFTSNDEFLIGRYSCGAYLFLGPVNSSAIQVEGSTQLANKNVQSGLKSALNIPLIFQFRAVDKLSYIGGFRANGNPTNVTYTKKIGVDIQVRNQAPFSFDVQVTGKYKNDVLSSPNFSTTTEIG